MADVSESYGLALAANAEVLQKMYDWVTKQETAEIRKAEARAEAAAKAAFAKEIVAAVKSELGLTKAIGNVTGESPQGLDVTESEKESVAGQTKWPMGNNTPGEDQEKPASPRTATKDVQKVIQASGDGRDVNDEEGKAGGAFAKNFGAGAPPPQDDGAEEYPHKEDEYDGDDVDSLKAQVKSLTEMVKSLVDVQKSDDFIKKSVAAQMRKIGVKEADELKSSRVRSLGWDDSDSWIKKSQNAKTEDELLDAFSGASYEELAKLEIENGKFSPTSGLAAMFANR
jgi:hypothetical protein